MPKTIEGVLTAIVTPFTATGSLNIPALKVQLNRQLEAGNAIFCARSLRAKRFVWVSRLKNLA